MTQGGRVGTSPTPTMDGGVVFAFVVGRCVFIRSFVGWVREVEGVLLLSIPWGRNAGCWISVGQAFLNGEVVQ